MINVIFSASMTLVMSSLAAINIINSADPVSCTLGGVAAGAWLVNTVTDGARVLWP